MDPQTSDRFIYQDPERPEGAGHGPRLSYGGLGVARGLEPTSDAQFTSDVRPAVFCFYSVGGAWLSDNRSGL